METAELNSIKGRVEDALQSMRPFLQADGGDVELVAITDEMDVQLRLTGSCKDCSMSEMTMKAGIEDGIRRMAPEIRNVQAI